MLIAHIHSFSYLQTPEPPDPWGHGGGFVFDCRFLPNPAWDSGLFSFTGSDRLVKEYMAAQPPVTAFLAAVAAIIDAAVAEYQRRNDEHLTIAFGCMGGQHRSVYCAEWLSERLKSNGCEVTLKHVALEESEI